MIKMHKLEAVCALMLSPIATVMQKEEEKEENNQSPQRFAIQCAHPDPTPPRPCCVLSHGGGNEALAHFSTTGPVVRASAVTFTLVSDGTAQSIPAFISDSPTPGYKVVLPSLGFDLCDTNEVRTVLTFQPTSIIQGARERERDTYRYRVSLDRGGQCANRAAQAITGCDGTQR